MAEPPSTHSRLFETVGVTHVPVPAGYCVIVPDDDLLVRHRFLWWCRAYQADGIMANEGWRALARRNLGAALTIATGGNEKALAKLIAGCPPLMQMPEVESLVLRALARYEPGLFSELARVLPKRTKRYVTPAMTKSGVNSLRATKSMLQAQARVARTLTIEELFEGVPSERSLIARTEGMEMFENTKRGKAMQVALERLKILRRTYPMVIRGMSDCRGSHRRQRECLHPGGELALAQAPRLLLRKSEGEDPRAVSLVAVL